MDGWLLGHAAFVVPIAFALYRVDTNVSRLAADRDTLRLMVPAHPAGLQSPANQRERRGPCESADLYLRLPVAFAVGYWRRVLSGLRGNSGSPLTPVPHQRRCGHSREGRACAPRPRNYRVRRTTAVRGQPVGMR